jgi:hypothetical protein
MIRAFLKDKLLLDMHERMTQIGPVAGGINFAGFIVRPGYQLVRRRTVGNLQEKLRQFRSQLVTHTPDYIAYRFDPDALANVLATVNSYLGHFRRAQTAQLVKKLFAQHAFLNRFFLRRKHKIVRLDNALRRARLLRHQIRWLLRTFPKHVCLIQIGSYVEAYGHQALVLQQATGLSLNQNWRGFPQACGFSQSQLSAMLSQLQQQRLPVILVQETGRFLRHTKERLITMIIEYPEKKLMSPISGPVYCGRTGAPSSSQR